MPVIVPHGEILSHNTRSTLFSCGFAFRALPATGPHHHHLDRPPPSFVKGHESTMWDHLGLGHRSTDPTSLLDSSNLFLYRYHNGKIHCKEFQRNSVKVEQVQRKTWDKSCCQ